MVVQPQSLPVKGSPPGRRAFTLVEMLVVITLIVILTTVVVVSLHGTMQASSLTSAGNKVTQICEMARQRAMSANVLTAVVLVTNLGTKEDGRAITMLEYPMGGPWQQTLEWNILPDGIVMDQGGALANTFVSFTPGKFPFSTGNGAPVGYSNHAAPLPAGSYAARIFLPGGGLLNPNDPAQFQIVEGTMENGATHYQEKNGPLNYYRISLLGNTGRTKVERPSL